MLEKPFSPACERNKEPILEVLKLYIEPEKAQSLFEIGSGTGQHAAFLAGQFPNLIWQTSDVAQNHIGIQAWIESAPNVLRPINYEVGKDSLPDEKYDYYFTANTLHIMSWPLAEKLLNELADHMKKGAYLFIYGPFCYNGEFTSASNKDFHQSLKERASEMGIRDFENVKTILSKYQIQLIKDHVMPANNQLLVFKK